MQGRESRVQIPGSGFQGLRSTVYVLGSISVLAQVVWQEPQNPNLPHPPLSGSGRQGISTPPRFGVSGRRILVARHAGPRGQVEESAPGLSSPLPPRLPRSRDPPPCSLRDSLGVCTSSLSLPLARSLSISLSRALPLARSLSLSLAHFLSLCICIHIDR